MDYRVRLASYEGPLDLLLYLVRRHEVDIRTVSLAQVTEQFLEAVAVMTTLDLDLAGEFLVVAATLLEIKAQALLPERSYLSPGTQDTADSHRGQPGAAHDLPIDRHAASRGELIQQLLAYRRSKEAALQLERQAAQAEKRHARWQPEVAVSGPEPSVQFQRVELWDLVHAFARVLRQAERLRPTTLPAADVPQQTYERELLARLEAEGTVWFEDLFTPAQGKPRLVAWFLAMLELVKQQRIALEQATEYGPIRLILKRVEVATAKAP